MRLHNYRLSSGSSISGICLCFFADQSQKEDPSVFELVRGSVEEVKLKGHDLCLKLTSTQNGEKVIFLSFTNAKEYEQWLRRCKKVGSAAVQSELIEYRFFVVKFLQNYYKYRRHDIDESK